VDEWLERLTANAKLATTEEIRVEEKQKELTTLLAGAYTTTWLVMVT
jgi:hypothetical protein